MEHEFDAYTKKEIVGTYTEPQRDLPVIDDVDVLVVGGSASGVAAAISAARNGSNVMLVERFGFLGGQSVFGSVTQWEKRAFINNLGAVATRGIAKEMLDRIVARGNSDGLWETPPGCEEMRDGEEWLDVEDIKLVLIEMCEEAGVDLLFHTLAVSTILEDNLENDDNLPKLRGVIFENKTGRFAYKAKVVIDATADLDLIWDAIGEKGCNLAPPGNRIGAGFYVYYGGVDTETYVQEALKKGNMRGYPSPEKYPDKVRKHLREGKLIIFSGFEDILEKADEQGYFEELEALMEELGALIMIRFGMKWVGKDRWCTSLTSLTGLNLLDAWELTKYEVLRTKLEHIALKIFRQLPGWEEAYIDRTNIYMGSRQTRTLKAEYMLTKEDIFEPNHDRKDIIGRSGAHDPGKNKLEAAYPIPYGIIVPEKLDGVLVCCRSVGTADRKATDAHRGITPGIVVGQGAGTAAAIAVEKNLNLREMDITELRKRLREADVVLDKEIVQLDVEDRNSDGVRF